MRKDSGWVAARGQIAWILALIVSITIIVQLEQVDFGKRLALLEENPLARTQLSVEAATKALADARTALQASPQNPHARAVMLVALSIANQAGIVADDTGQAEAQSLIATAHPDDALWQSALILATASFPALEPAAAAPGN